jgi:hypothetical protein
MSRPPPDSVPCYACAGRFTFAHDHASDRFVCRHTEPWCEPFDDIQSTLDALRFAQACDVLLKPEKEPPP